MNDLSTRSLLDAICQDPDDNRPRLALADALVADSTPVAQARGEYIRLQIQQASLPESTPSHERAALVRRASALRFLHDDAWARESLPEAVYDLPIGWTYNRGCIEEITESPLCDPSPESLERLLRLVPLRRLLLQLSEPPASLTASLHAVLASTRVQQQILALHLVGDPIALLQALATFAPREPPAWRALCVSSNPQKLEAEVATIPLSSSALPNIDALGFGFAPWGDALELDASAVAALVSAPRAAQLVTLSMHSNLGDEAVEELSNAPALSGLKTLDLSQNTFTTRGLRSLAQSAAFGALETLRIGKCGRFALAEVLMLLRTHKRLRRLDLNQCLSATDACALLRSPEIAGLSELGIAGCDIGDSGADAIAHNPALSRRERLDLARSSISADGIASLLTTPRLHTLRSLELEENPLGAVGGDVIASASVLEGLEYLGLFGAGIEAETDHPHRLAEPGVLRRLQERFGAALVWWF